MKISKLSETQAEILGSGGWGKIKAAALRARIPKGGRGGKQETCVRHSRRLAHKPHCAITLIPPALIPRAVVLVTLAQNKFAIPQVYSA